MLAVRLTDLVPPYVPARVTTQLLLALPSPAVRSVVNVMTRPAIDATVSGDPFGVALHVSPVASASCRTCPATMDSSITARVTVLAVPESMDSTVAEVIAVLKSRATGVELAPARAVSATAMHLNGNQVCLERQPSSTNAFYSRAERSVHASSVSTHVAMLQRVWNPRMHLFQ